MFGLLLVLGTFSYLEQQRLSHDLDVANQQVAELRTENAQLKAGLEVLWKGNVVLFDLASTCQNERDEALQMLDRTQTRVFVSELLRQAYDLRYGMDINEADHVLQMAIDYAISKDGQLQILRPNRDVLAWISRHYQIEEKPKTEDGGTFIIITQRPPQPTPVPLTH